MDTKGTDRRLDRPRIKKLLGIGLFASVITGIGDFLLVIFCLPIPALWRDPIWNSYNSYRTV